MTSIIIIIIISFFSRGTGKVVKFSLIFTTVEAVSLNRTSECRGNFQCLMCRRNLIFNIFFFCITFEFLWINPLTF
jgi:hypothetical protein